MPLPEPNTQWPPHHLVKPHNDIAGWSAWWGGDPEVLSRHYGGTADTTSERSFERSWSGRGGLVGALQRFFWGQPTRHGEQRAKLHIPVAAEIAQVSADLLFAAPPKITVDDKPTQEVIDRLLGESVHTLLHESAEAGAALGHSWMRVGIDRDILPDRPIISTVDADAAFPVYAYGHLREVAFLSEHEEHGGTIFRHFENHSVRNGRGAVEHALYKGDVRSLGHLVPLSDHATTDPLAGLVGELGDGRQGIATGLSRLDVVGVSNARTRTWRKLPRARDLGRADVSGVEGEMDALDDTWSSWMRDIRHGRSRIHVPNTYLQSLGAGKGAIADLDAELYVGLQTMPSNEGMELTATQFKIRWQEHERTAAMLLERIFSGAGYSPQTFGLADVAAITAMESWNRQIRTQNTRAGKVRRWRQGLLELIAIVLEYDRLQFGGRGRADVPPEVHFQESVAESSQARAQVASLLKAAGAASTKTLVSMQHPDWDEEQIDAEVALIVEENTIVLNDPIDEFDNAESTTVPAEEEDEAEDPAEDDESKDSTQSSSGRENGTQPRRKRTRGGVAA